MSLLNKKLGVTCPNESSWRAHSNAGTVCVITGESSFTCKPNKRQAFGFRVTITTRLYFVMHFMLKCSGLLPILVPGTGKKVLGTKMTFTPPPPPPWMVPGDYLLWRLSKRGIHGGRGTIPFYSQSESVSFPVLLPPGIMTYEKKNRTREWLRGPGVASYACHVITVVALTLVFGKSVTSLFLIWCPALPSHAICLVLLDLSNRK